MTVDAGPERRAELVALCERIGVRCVLIELATGRTPSQPMTAAYHRGELASVMNEVESHHEALVEGGFSVIRVKLEAVATNEGVPISDEEAASFPDAYFEFHAKLRLAELTSSLDALRTLCLAHGAHLSHNDRKVDVERGSRDRFVTLRVRKSGRARAAAAFEALVVVLKEASYEVVGVKREFTVYDSRAALDAGWLEPSSTRAGP